MPRTGHFILHSNVMPKITAGRYELRTEQTGLPFLVASNTFFGDQLHQPEEIREALAVPANVPVLLCDARERQSTKHILIELVQHALAMAGQPVVTG